MGRKRLRELGIGIGELEVGKYNSITDVEGVIVGHKTIIDKDVVSGVTIIMPNEGKLEGCHFPAGIFRFNGTGEFTGYHWIKETGTLVSPIIFTGSHLLGMAHRYLDLATRKVNGLEPFSMGVVGETWDGWLSDIEKTTMEYKDLEEAILSAKSGVIEEGNVGGGAGMIAFEFKGGIGTSSRMINCNGMEYTIGAIVQSNFGRRKDFMIEGKNIGSIISDQEVPLPWTNNRNKGSLLVTIATDAPLTASQCERVSKRAALAMARVGDMGDEGSGDFFLTFSTGNKYSYDNEQLNNIRMLQIEELDKIFQGAIESVTEAILNSMTMAETIEGQKGRKVYELPLDKLKEIFD